MRSCSATGCTANCVEAEIKHHAVSLLPMSLILLHGARRDVRFQLLVEPVV